MESKTMPKMLTLQQFSQLIGIRKARTRIWLHYYHVGLDGAVTYELDAKFNYLQQRWEIPHKEALRIKKIRDQSYTSKQMKHLTHIDYRNLSQLILDGILVRVFMFGKPYYTKESVEQLAKQRSAQ